MGCLYMDKLKTGELIREARKALKEKGRRLIFDLFIDCVISFPYLFLFWYGMWWFVFAIPVVLLLCYWIRNKILYQKNEKISKTDIIGAVVNTIIVLVFAYVNTYLLCSITGVWP